MKKLISVLLIVMLCFGSFAVQASSLPSFMYKIYNNYTAGYNVSMKINNADEIAGFFKELNLEQIENYIDVKALIESLMTVNSTINVQADVSNDFRKMNVAVTVDTDQNVVFNRNYETSYRAKLGIWTKMDLDKKEIVVVYSTPLNEKYAVVDFSRDFPEEERDRLFELYDEMLSRENIEKHNKKILEIGAKHADISVKGKTVTLHYDNDSFVAFVDDVLKYMTDFYADMLPEFQFPSLQGMKLLGEEGITCKFTYSGNTIKSFSEKWDISIELAEIFTSITGMPWDYNFDGNISISFQSDGDVGKIGTTEVSMPVLTEENSFCLFDLLNTEDDYNYAVPEDEPYISPYAWGYVETDTFDGERFYLPLRMSIEDIYYDYSVITYDEGAVTITTNCGIEGRDINASFNVGEDKAIVNGVAYDGFGAFKMIDDSVYASVDFYEKCLGWTLTSLQKDLIDGSLYYGFYTTEE